MATLAFDCPPARRRAAVSLLVLALLAGTARAQDASPVDPRSGSVRIYVSLATSAMTRLVAAMSRHFPNLKIDFVRAGSVETVKRFVAERQAGRIGADLIHGADPGGFEYFAQKGWLDPRLAALPLAQDYRDGFVNKQAGWVALRATGIALMYNTKLVAKDALPKTWKELIEPKWKGRIAISDPTRAGSSFSHLYAMWKMYGGDYLDKLAKNDVFVAGDGSATREAVANGERDVAPVSEYDAFELKKNGKPVDIDWVADGTIMVPAPLAVVKGSPNADNALALAQYMLSREGQELITNVILSWSARKDVKAPQGKPDLDSIKLVSFDWDKAAAEKGQLLDLYFKYFQSR
ncbi:MAG TPA: extracellular solute-binding protein [Xanthobacteraceae bacterium]|nr:extracellular solute-binding protein [Xanthobacteraceae bacterium]